MENKQQYHPCPRDFCDCFGKRWHWSARRVYNTVWISAVICLMATVVFIALIIASDAALNIRINVQKPEKARVIEIVKACRFAVDALNDELYCGHHVGSEEHRLLIRLSAREDPRCQNATILPTVDTILTCGISFLTSDAKDALWITSFVFCILFGLGFVILIIIYVRWQCEEKTYNAAYARVGETETSGTRETVEHVELGIMGQENVDSASPNINTHTSVMVNGGTILV